jgi:hypothetical protein
MKTDQSWLRKLGSGKCIRELAVTGGFPGRKKILHMMNQTNRRKMGMGGRKGCFWEIKWSERIIF